MDSDSGTDQDDGNQQEVSNNEKRLRSHFVALRTHLEKQLFGFGELDLALSDLAALGARCLRLCLSSDMFEALDEAMVSIGDVSDPEAVVLDIDLPDDDPCENATSDAHREAAASSMALERRAEVLAVAGDYFSLFMHLELARAQYRAALELNPRCLPAQLGHARICAQRLSSNREFDETQQGKTAVTQAMQCVELLLAGGLRLGDLGWERQACQCFHLLDDVVSVSDLDVFESESDLDKFQFLSKCCAYLRTSAASAIVSLARRLLLPAPWRQQPLESIDGVLKPFPPCVIALLVDSQTFCCPSLERYAAHWRHHICSALRSVVALSRSCGLEQKGTAHIHNDDPPGWPMPLFTSGAALGCHFCFVGYCIPNENDFVEAAAFTEARSKIAEPGVAGIAAWLLAAMYEPVVSEPPAELQEWRARQRHHNAVRGAEGVVDAAGTEHFALLELLERCVYHPREEAVLAETLEPLDPSRCVSDTPCIAFYDETVYPPWHHNVDSAGAMPTRIDERLSRLFPWRRIDDTKQRAKRRSRVLIAGCGSGHQIVVEMRTYAKCDFVALDCSLRTVAHAKRKLRAVLNHREFSRIRFIVGDILDLKPGLDITAGAGFDLVICCGVLHHLRNPEEGLKRLASVLAPNGLIQLATYSRLSVNSWRSPVMSFLASDAVSSHLFCAGELRHIPRRDEVRAIRRRVFALDPGHEARDLLVHFPEFFSHAGILDLLFHPLETSYTLLELESGPLSSAGLEVVGVLFLDVNADIAARRRFRAFAGIGDDASDPRMVDLARWHKLETSDPEIFGRMHSLFLERNASFSTKKRPRTGSG